MCFNEVLQMQVEILPEMVAFQISCGGCSVQDNMSPSSYLLL